MSKLTAGEKIMAVVADFAATHGISVEETFYLSGIAGEVDFLKHRLKAVERENRELRKALTPLAEVGKAAGAPNLPDTVGLWAHSSNIPSEEVVLTLGHARAALRLLTPTPEAPKEDDHE